MIETERLLLRRPTEADVESPPPWLSDPEVIGEPELGWALAREHWGSGYATEAALAVREWLRAPRVVSLIAPDNVRSQKVTQRLAASRERSIELPAYGPHAVWVHPR